MKDPSKKVSYVLELMSMSEDEDDRGWNRVDNRDTMRMHPNYGDMTLATVQELLKANLDEDRDEDTKYSYQIVEIVVEQKERSLVVIPPLPVLKISDFTDIYNYLKKRRDKEAVEILKKYDDSAPMKAFDEFVQVNKGPGK